MLTFIACLTLAEYLMSVAAGGSRHVAELIPRHKTIVFMNGLRTVKRLDFSSNPKALSGLMTPCDSRDVSAAFNTASAQSVEEAEYSASFLDKASAISADGVCRFRMAGYIEHR